MLPLKQKLPHCRAASDLRWSESLSWSCVENGVAEPSPVAVERTLFVRVPEAKVKKQVPPLPGSGSSESDDDFWPLLRAAEAQLSRLDFLQAVEALDGGHQCEL